MSKKICILSGLHLSTNPRVWKEANSLANAGYKVVIISVWRSAEIKNRDVLLIHNKNIQYKAAPNLIKGEAKPFKRFYIRARNRVSREATKRLKINSSWSIGFSPNTMINAAIEEKAELYIAHTEFGIAVGKSLIEKGYKVAYDIEDWYSHDYLVPDRPVGLFKSLEKFALANGVYCTCPSQAMADALQDYYSSKKPVHVIYNGFSEKENINVKTLVNKKPSLIWFSQTTGAGRGLETVLKCLNYVEIPLELNLIGNISQDYSDELKKAFPYHRGHNLIIQPPVNHNELIATLAQHDIGLALENNFPESRNKTITNKILQYLQAGIKVLATATDGQKEVAKHFKETVAVVPVEDAEIWAEQIKILLKKVMDRQNIVEQFNTTFSWEIQEKNAPFS